MYLGGKRPDGTPHRGFLTPPENAVLNERGKFVCCKSGQRIKPCRNDDSHSVDEMDVIAIVGFDPYKNAGGSHA